jgi:aminopeptidase N
VHFHRIDGAGYRLIADNILQLDAVNAQVAASLVSSFNAWRRFDDVRQQLMQDELRRIGDKPGLSKDVGEIVTRSLANAS